ncbi:FAD-dependent oxidoreductase [Cellulomonas fengjieae]|uniref:NAD(P)/FAD-dependent oxidoreductase n=1 Tax=Cellulomonas fengjieae TaxID=2819978 RepID=A0ABS3SDF5_9CELL|nr:FAD-dependent oxidoreductase [Cellulomonas fengjieae]MBO3083784.1 NAD(P)/FAD-dependent oxidoreductase [Cellulomonas fengjieae]QVI64925.1 NAD(P)/FAD-dependent oxidoreductase [Cellulomonas fengjieae]
MSTQVRVVVVGHGMVGARFVDDLHQRDPDARFRTVVLGAEEYEPYNRVLLSEVVAGKLDVAAIALPRAAQRGVAEILPGTTAVTVDRCAGVVHDQAGERHPYDVLVLATGARARVPDLFGRRPGDDLPAGVHALRTLDDAREIVAATANARRAVVVGGGVLGLEVACGLAHRGLAVTVVHGGAHLMDRQLDGPAATVALARLTALGIGVRVGTRTEEAVVGGGRMTGVRLEGGEMLPADLLVLTAGTVPEVALAQRAGLDVARGIVVGPDLASPSDARVFAIGDCAEPPEGGSGLIAQGWDQARRLATLLTEPSAARDAVPLPTVGTDVVKVKGVGLDVVAMGECGSRSGSPGRRVRLSDPEGGRHIEVVVADGRVVGATCVGAGPVAADLVAAYTRGTPVPADPAQLLLRPVAGTAVPAVSPTMMPDRAVVCRCNGVTKGDIVGCWRHGARSVEDVAAATRATTGCGGCQDAVCGIVDWLRRADPDQTAPSPDTVHALTG